MENNLVEKKLSSEMIYDGKVLHVYKDQVTLPNGHTALREVMRHVGAVCMVALTEDNRVVVERQFRYPVDSVITEIPAGKLDSFTEDRLSAAKRELEEETGYRAANWQELGDFHPTPAYCDEKITLYLATGLQEGVRHLDEDEFLNMEAVPLSELVADVMAGRITDGKTQTAILKTAYLVGHNL